MRALFAVCFVLGASCAQAADIPDYVDVPYRPRVVPGPPPVSPNTTYTEVPESHTTQYNSQVIINNNITINNPPLPAPAYIGRPYPHYGQPVPLYVERPYVYAPRFQDGSMPSSGEWEGY